MSQAAVMPPRPDIDKPPPADNPAPMDMDELFAKRPEGAEAP